MASHRTARAAWLLALLAGLVALALSLRLPWTSQEFELGAPVRLVVAGAGTALLLLVARDPARHATGGGLLGASVLTYPSLLGLAGSGSGGPAVAVLASAWHVVPLTLVQVVPLLASAQASGRRHRRWETGLLVAALAGVVLTGLGLYAAPSLLLPSTVLWFASFTVSPAVTWAAVRGTAGEVRRRLIVAALASLAPVVLLTWCVSLGTLGAGLGVDWSVSALMVGFSAGTLACGALALGALAPPGSPVLGPRAVAGALHGLVATLALIVVSVAALLLSGLGVPAGWALPAGAVLAVGLVLPWRRLSGWVARVVDPAAELRHELSLLGHVPDGGHRQAALQVLRRVTDDPGLELDYAGAPEAAAAETVVLARRPDRTPSVVAHPGSGSTSRLHALGDCSQVLQPAVLEAQLAHESRRADHAAEAERQRLTQDLHDGLQGRLLGLALHLQLGAGRLEDPAAELLTDEAVAALRSMVDDVRALGGGRLPDLLVRDGLAPALSAVFGPANPVVRLDLPTTRFGADAEAAAYFVVGEAVTNALKHAAAQRIDVRVALEADRQVTVVVSDDGRGGADPRLGTGLRGLAERVAASGGALVVQDGTPGTTVEAVLPCGS